MSDGSPLSAYSREGGKVNAKRVTGPDLMKELLMRSDLSVSQAGEQTGFASSSHFSHVFKKMEGMTPSEFRSAYFRQLQS